MAWFVFFDENTSLLLKDYIAGHVYFNCVCVCMCMCAFVCVCARAHVCLCLSGCVFIRVSRINSLCQTEQAVSTSER